MWGLLSAIGGSFLPKECVLPTAELTYPPPPQWDPDLLWSGGEECLGLGATGGGVFFASGTHWSWLTVTFTVDSSTGVFELGEDSCLGEGGATGDAVGCLGDRAGETIPDLDIVLEDDSGENFDCEDSLLLRFRLVGRETPSEGGGLDDTRILAMPRGRSLSIC